MTNLSELTRREQVLARLQDADGAWVDGADLSNAECGGSEGLKRLRELRQPLHGGHDIKMRQKPGSDQFQYRLVVDKIADDFKHDAFVGGPPYIVGENPIAGQQDLPQQTPPSKNPVHLGRTESGDFVVVNDTPPPEVADVPLAQVPGQTDLGVKPGEWFKFEKAPTHLDMGTMRLCPMCKGYRKPIYDPVLTVVGPKGSVKKKINGYEERTMDPRKGHKDDYCERCNGFGVVPT